jgi:hypothetical protein
MSFIEYCVFLPLLRSGNDWIELVRKEHKVLKMSPPCTSIVNNIQEKGEKV